MTAAEIATLLRELDEIETFVHRAKLRHEDSGAVRLQTRKAEKAIEAMMGRLKRLKLAIP